MTRPSLICRNLCRPLFVFRLDRCRRRPAPAAVKIALSGAECNLVIPRNANLRKERDRASRVGVTVPNPALCYFVWAIQSRHAFRECGGENLFPLTAIK